MRTLRIILAVAFAIALIIVPARYAGARYFYMRNFHVVDEGKLYRSGQLSPDALSRVLHDHQIKTVVSLRYANKDETVPADAWEEKFCFLQGVRHVRIRPDVWIADEKGLVPGQKAVDEFLALIKNPDNHPVLVHCFRGAHRTGSFCALYRMEQQGWTNAEAIAELKGLGYDNLDNETDVLGYMERYRSAAAGKDR